MGSNFFEPFILFARNSNYNISMYELKLFNYLEEQYNSLIREGVLQLDVNWELHKPSFMRRKDKMLYEILLKELVSGLVINYGEIEATSTGDSASQVLIKKFFIEYFEYPNRVADYYKENYFDKNPGAEKEPLKIPNEIRHDAAVWCRLSGPQFKMSRHFPLKKRYKFLKLKGEFEKIGYDRDVKDVDKV